MGQRGRGQGQLVREPDRLLPESVDGDAQGPCSAGRTQPTVSESRAVTSTSMAPSAPYTVQLRVERSGAGRWAGSRAPGDRDRHAAVAGSSPRNLWTTTPPVDNSGDAAAPA